MKRNIVSCIMIVLIALFTINSKRTRIIGPEIESNNKHNVEIAQVSLIMAGDMLIHDTVYKNGYSNGIYDYKYIFDYIKPYIQSHDLAFVNQETILGGVELGLSTYPRFNSPQEIGDALIDTGFNLISTANNHTLDIGEKGVISSHKYWSDKNVIFSGHEVSPNISHIKTFEKNGIKFGFVAYTTLTNGLNAPIGKEYLQSVYDYEQAKKDIESVEDAVDFILVAMHWGREYQNHEWHSQQKIALELSELGADLIIGSHPHVVQPINYINGTMVIYSLGNFLSNQIGIDRLIGALVSVNFEKTTVNGKIQSVAVSKPYTKLVYHNKDENGKFFIKFLSNFISLKDKYVEKIALITHYLKDIVVE